jgi:hypothetical protein
LTPPPPPPLVGRRRKKSTAARVLVRTSVRGLGDAAAADRGAPAGEYGPADSVPSRDVPSSPSDWSEGVGEASWLRDEGVGDVGPCDGAGEAAL